MCARREGTEREGRECRRKGDGGTEVEHGTAVMDVDTSEGSLLRSRIGDEAGEIGSHGEDEAVVGDLAPQAPSHAEGDGEEKTSVKRKRQTEKRKSGPKAAEDVIEKEERQPQLSATKMTVPDNCGSKRRRVLDKKEDYHIEKTKKKAGENTMKERLEGDEGIE